MRKVLCACAIVAMVLVVALAAPPKATAELIDRVLAIVDGNVITQSDVSAALIFKFVRTPPPGSDPVRVTLDELIRRALMLSDVNRYGAVEVDQALLSKRFATIRSMFSSQQDYEAALARTAMTEVRLRETIEGDARIEEYVRQRFGAVAAPTDDEVAAYYDAHRADFTVDGKQMTLAQAAPMARQRLTAERRATVMDDWVVRLRRRAEVNDLYFADTARK